MDGVLGLLTAWDAAYGTWIKPPRTSGSCMDIIGDPVQHLHMVADIGSGGVGQTGRISGVLDGLDHGLHGKIAEVRGIPIRKYQNSSMGWTAFVIRILASVMLMATRSGVTPNLPPAWPTLMTISGRLSFIFSWILSMDLPTTVRDLHGDDLCPGDLISDTFYGLPGQDLSDSPPNGSNPVTNTFMTFPLSCGTPLRRMV